MKTIGTVIVDCAIHLHQDIGRGPLETVYEVTLARKLEKQGLSVQRQVPIAIEYEGQKLDEGRHHANRSWRFFIPSLCLRAFVRTKLDRTKGSTRAGISRDGSRRSVTSTPGRVIRNDLISAEQLAMENNAHE